MRDVYIEASGKTQEPETPVLFSTKLQAAEGGGGATSSWLTSQQEFPSLCSLLALNQVRCPPLPLPVQVGPCTGVSLSSVTTRCPLQVHVCSL
jgi:hypothetical protein